MNNIVLQYAREEYKYNIPKLLFDLDSQDEINVTIGAGMEKEVSFHATNSAKTMFSGVVVSESLFVDVLTPEFSGENNEIKLKIDSTAYSENSTFKGVVRVFTECGNANIRVNVDVKNAMVSDGCVLNNLKDFAEIFKENSSKAIKIFKSEFLKKQL